MIKGASFIGIIAFVICFRIVCEQSVLAQIRASGSAQISGAVRIAATTNDSPFAFIDSSDIHIDRPNTFSGGEPSNNFQKFFSMGASFVIMTGDMADQSCHTSYLKWQQITSAYPTMPILGLAGNHDACGQCCDNSCDAGIDPCADNYTNYLNDVNAQMHWTVDVGSVLRFIGFNSLIIREGAQQNFGQVIPSELNYVTSAIAQAVIDGKKVVLCTHFPLLDFFGNNIKSNQATLLNAMSNAGNVFLYLGGHRHQWGGHVTNAGTVHVNCPGLSYSLSEADPPYSVTGGFFYVGVTNRVMTFQLYAANDPTYTIRLTNFTVAF